MSIIHHIEKNIRGAWTIYGLLGIRQYYYYTKAEAMRKYKEEYKHNTLGNSSLYMPR